MPRPKGPEKKAVMLRLSPILAARLKSECVKAGQTQDEYIAEAILLRMDGQALPDEPVHLPPAQAATKLDQLKASLGLKSASDLKTGEAKPHDKLFPQSYQTDTTPWFDELHKIAAKCGGDHNLINGELADRGVAHMPRNLKTVQQQAAWLTEHHPLDD